jgi:hypothetical protein
MVKISNTGGKVEFPAFDVVLAPGANYINRVPPALEQALRAQPGVFHLELIDDADVPEDAEVTVLAKAGTAQPERVEQTDDAADTARAFLVAELEQTAADHAAELQRQTVFHADQLKAKGLEFDNDLAEERKLFDDKLAKEREDHVAQLAAERSELEAERAALVAEREAFERAKAEQPPPADKPAKG